MADTRRRRLWPEGAHGAVSLSYDGGDPSHLETAAPCLEALSLKGTFYVPPTKVLEAPNRWAALAAAGHEIGDAGMFDAAGPSGLLQDWTSQMVENDLHMSREFYDGLFGKDRARSLAYPILRPEARADRESAGIEALQQISLLRPLVRSKYSVARGSVDGHNDPTTCDVLALRCIQASGYIAEELILLARQALDAGAWAVFAFEGVGVGEHAVDAMEHAKLCLWLAERRTQALLGTVAEVGALVGTNSRVVVDRSHHGAVRARVGPDV